jgi:hypothetical protein
LLIFFGVFFGNFFFSYPFEETPIETETAVEPKESGEDNTEAPVAENTEDGSIVQTKNRTIHHNVNYRTWNVKKTTSQNTLMKNQIKDEEINLLVRCKLDACEVMVDLTARKSSLLSCRTQREVSCTP